VKQFILMLALLCILPLQANAATREEQRTEIQRSRADTLDTLYRIQPSAMTEVRNAAGYAVFSSADIAAIFVSGSYGHGIAHNNRTGEETYMQMASAGVGLGLGAKDFRTVFIFDNENVFNDFITTGLDLSGHIDVAVKKGTAGNALSGAVDVLPGVSVYQLTETGLLAQAMLKGTKYWRDNSLNENDLSSDVSRDVPAYNR
jgi:lipid-binding SYLF domain-containing protein